MWDWNDIKENEGIRAILNDLWRAMMDHPWITLLTLIFIAGISTPWIIVPFIALKGIDMVRQKH